MTNETQPTPDEIDPQSLNDVVGGGYWEYHVQATGEVAAPAPKIIGVL